MKIQKALVPLLFLSALASSAPALAWSGGPGHRPGGGDAGLNTLYSPLCAPTPDPSSALSATQISALRHMREEEKLARDTYQYFGGRWNSRVFINIAASEQAHMDQVLLFLQAYGLSDPAAANAGSFNDASLQQLYAQLTALGNRSLLEALRAAALVEETDIRDLRLAAADASDGGLRQMYLNLTSASYSHLNAVVGQIERLGGSYAAQVLDPSDVASILSGAAVPGLAIPGSGLNGANAAIATATCFSSTVQTASRQYPSGARIPSGEMLTIDTAINVEPALVGRPADLIIVVEYTPAGVPTPMLLMRAGDNWVAWDGNRYSLAAALRVDLAQQQRLRIFQGSLAGLPGQFKVSTGYRLDDGTLIFAASAIDFTIE